MAHGACGAWCYVPRQIKGRKAIIGYHLQYIRTEPRLGKVECEAVTEPTNVCIDSHGSEREREGRQIRCLKSYPTAREKADGATQP